MDLLQIGQFGRGRCCCMREFPHIEGASALFHSNKYALARFGATLGHPAKGATKGGMNSIPLSLSWDTPWTPVHWVTQTDPRQVKWNFPTALAVPRRLRVCA